VPPPTQTGYARALSQAVHERLGFTETERVVYFNMRLNPDAA
jgi:hypothetical protein